MTNIMSSKMSGIILNALTTKKARTLHELYAIARDNHGSDLEESVRRHRVRSSIDSLLRTKKIRRVGTGIYALINQID